MGKKAKPKGKKASAKNEARDEVDVSQLMRRFKQEAGSHPNGNAVEQMFMYHTTNDIPLRSICVSYECGRFICNCLCIALEAVQYKQIRVLCFWNARIGNEGGKCVAGVLRHMVNLSRLEMVDCGIGPESCESLGEALALDNKTKRSLISLKLCHNNLKPQDDGTLSPIVSIPSEAHMPASTKR
eukprot:218413_1